MKKQFKYTQEIIARIMSSYLRTGQSIDHPNNHNQTFLHLVCSHGFFNEVITCISLGANPNIVDNFSYSPLRYAIKNNHLSIANYLMHNGAKVDSINFTEEEIDWLIDNLINFNNYLPSPQDFSK